MLYWNHYMPKKKAAHGPPLLHHDRDFDLIAGVEPKLVLVAVGK
jgi:hypothetical protein